MSVISGTIGAVMGSEAQTDAANTAASAQNKATEAQERIYEKQRADYEPFRQIGVGAIDDYTKMLHGGYNMQESPSAKYALAQGTKSMNRNLAARGLSGSGNAAQRLSELSSGIAASDYTSQYNRLADALKVGTGASSAMSQASNQMSGALQQGASNLGNIAMNAGNARASLYSGLGGASANTAAAGLKAYQAYNSGNMYATMPSSAASAPEAMSYEELTAAGF